MMMFAHPVRHPRKSQRGYAIILVLWALILLSFLSAMLISQNRMAARMEANAWAAMEAAQAAEAAFTIGLMKLHQGALQQNGFLYGAPVSFEFNGVRGKVAIQDELGKIDLNAASEQTLRELLRGAGASPSEIEFLTSRTIEWRDARNARRPFAVVIEEYKNKLLPYAPRGASFESIDELRLILGMREDLFDALRPAITVYTRAPSYDLSAAPEVLLRATPGVSPERVQSILSRRAGTGVGDGRKDGSEAKSPRIPIEGRAFTIEVSFEFIGQRYIYEKVVRISGNPAEPVWTQQEIR